MEKKKRRLKILFISPVPVKGAGARFRIAQFMPYFKNRGIDGTISPFYSDRFFDIVYKQGRVPEKIFHFFISILRRVYDLFRSLRYDIVFIYREACPVGPPVFEWVFSHLKPIIYDFDDAIYLYSTSRANRFVKFLKYPAKVPKIIKLANHIIVCNDFLKKFAIRFNKDVSVIPTSIDTDIFVNIDKNGEQKKPVIGWIGSHTTAEYLPMLEEVFRKLAKRHKFTLKIVGADTDLSIPGVEVISQPWSLEKEVSDYQNFDIGVYPLEGNEWDLGKTGFKTVVYMSVGVVPVVSNVGSNKEIIKDGVNGFLADTETEWIDKISNLIEAPRLRYGMGKIARDTVIKSYSVKANASKYIDIFKKVIGL